ncbi:Sulfotransferase family protein [Neorhodopirellula lusitana]|uniref:Sulfotransferase family protein n=1 Tax=Neorhodopirellula lusitana TaxID=445327 RepID=A0ABY1PYZ2_9BACT|nr:sulfotransferase [Neorhodopirellula lusitana]SMP51673.1 Sulfotransferase family protein [Neorhodopirellula lusitana]
MKRTDPEMVEKYQKDLGEESFLEKLNVNLQSFDQSLHADDLLYHPSVYVYGVPRSGTTLLYQYIAAHLSVDYISNLTAAFWEAPVVGLKLSKKLLGSDRTLETSSHYGRTRDPAGAHEFGYFWANHLRYSSLKEPTDLERDSVDWETLRQTIGRMSQVNCRPIAFKPLMAGWYAERMHSEIPRSLFVWIRRDRIQNAMSILQMRREMLGSEEKWMSLIPFAYEQLKELPAWDQIAGQVWHIEHSFQQQFDSLPNDRKLCVQYEDFCSDPATTIAEIAGLLQRQGINPGCIKMNPNALRANQRDIKSDPVYTKIADAFDRLDQTMSD